MAKQLILFFLGVFQGFLSVARWTVWGNGQHIGCPTVHPTVDQTWSVKHWIDPHESRHTRRRRLEIRTLTVHLWCNFPLLTMNFISNDPIRQFCMELNGLAVRLQSQCFPATCTQMTATEQWIFLCAAHKTPKECPAIDYTRHTLDGAACLLNSYKYFPSRWVSILFHFWCRQTIRFLLRFEF